MAPSAPSSSIPPQSTSTATPTPPAPYANSTSNYNGGFGPVAVIGIIAGIILILAGVVILGLLMRRNARNKERRILVKKTSSPQVKDGSLKGIVVTRVFETKEMAAKPDPWDDSGRNDSVV